MGRSGLERVLKQDTHSLLMSSDPIKADPKNVRAVAEKLGLKVHVNAPFLMFPDSVRPLVPKGMFQAEHEEYFPKKSAFLLYVDGNQTATGKGFYALNSLKEYLEEKLNLRMLPLFSGNERGHHIVAIYPKGKEKLEPFLGEILSLAKKSKFNPSEVTFCEDFPTTARLTPQHVVRVSGPSEIIQKMKDAMEPKQHAWEDPRGVILKERIVDLRRLQSR